MPLTRSRVFLVVLCLLFASTAAGFSAFKVQDIRVEGLQRLEVGTVLTYLPVSVGDTVSPERARQSIRALYDSGLFQDVRLAKQGNTLIVHVTERPVIASFSIEGNHKIKGEKLKKNLRKQGFAQGRVYRGAKLDQLELQLRRQYYANGFYGVQIKTDIEQLDGNRVAITIHVKEGEIATIRSINIVGNEKFTDERLLETFKLEPSKSFWRQPLVWLVSDQYSRQKLLGDLESLSSFYKNRGYLRFRVKSIQVSISPDKKDIFLTINVKEGTQYKVDSIKFAGDLIIPEKRLRDLVSVRSNAIFSRKRVTKSADRITSALADFGYASANVDPLTRLNRENKTVDLTFFVGSGDRTYVRRITFQGNSNTNDKTLRRELRQFEAGLYSSTDIKRSRIRLQRLRYLKNVKVETERVSGSKDMMDVHFKVTERPAGSLQFGVGYSDAQGFLINARITHNNFRGTGNRLSLRAETNEYATVFAGSWTDPYFTDEGISRTISAKYRDSEQIIRFGSGFDLNTITLGVDFGLPISEYAQLNLGAGISKNEINTRVEPFNTFSGAEVYPTSRELRTFIQENGKEFLGYELRVGWSRDTRNRTIFATKGSRSEISIDFKLPGSTIEYYTINMEHAQFFNFGTWFDWLSDDFALKSNIRIATTSVWGSGEDIPPYAHFFAGGARSVRGFKNGYLGPRDQFDNPYGGQFLTTMQNELIIPTFLDTTNKSTRFALFYDIGNVYNSIDTFEADKLRSSAGVAFYWLTPFFGLLRVSYATYVESMPNDEVDRFQFSFGIGF